jgi:hypothetical protein
VRRHTALVKAGSKRSRVVSGFVGTIPNHDTGSNFHFTSTTCCRYAGRKFTARWRDQSNRPNSHPKMTRLIRSMLPAVVLCGAAQSAPASPRPTPVPLSRILRRDLRRHRGGDLCAWWKH